MSIEYFITKIVPVDYSKRLVYSAGSKLINGIELESEYDIEALLSYLLNLSEEELIELYPYNKERKGNTERFLSYEASDKEIDDDMLDDMLSNIEFDHDITERKRNMEHFLSNVMSDIETEDQNVNLARKRLEELKNDPMFQVTSLISQQSKETRDLYRDAGRGYIQPYICKKIISYMKSLGDTEERGEEDIGTDIIKAINTKKQFKPFEDIKDILIDQNSHLHNDELSCSLYNINITQDGFDLGGIFCFYNEKEPTLFNGKKCMMIQDITKYTIPMLTQLIYPQFSPNVPKLNTVLETPLNIVAQLLDCDYIIVRPLENQEKILIKHYGYVKSGEKFKLPCKTISSGWGPWLYKQIERDYLPNRISGVV